MDVVPRARFTVGADGAAMSVDKGATSGDGGTALGARNAGCVGRTAPGGMAAAMDGEVAVLGAAEVTATGGGGVAAVG